MLTTSTIKNFMESIINGQFGVNIVAETLADNEMNLTLSGKGSPRNPYLGRVTKRIIGTNIKVGCQFASLVTRKADNGQTYKSEARKGMEWVIYPFITRGIKSQREFLTFPYRLCDKRTNFCHKYYLDGVLMTPSQMEDMKRYFKKKSNYSAKQDAFTGGTQTEVEMTSVLNYDINGILYLGLSEENAKAIYEK